MLLFFLLNATSGDSWTSAAWGCRRWRAWASRAWNNAATISRMSASPVGKTKWISNFGTFVIQTVWNCFFFNFPKFGKIDFFNFPKSQFSKFSSFQNFKFHTFSKFYPKWNWNSWRFVIQTVRKGIGAGSSRTRNPTGPTSTLWITSQQN